MFRVKPDVHRRASIAAELSGKSLNQWAEDVLEEVAEGYDLDAHEHIRKRA